MQIDRNNYGTMLFLSKQVSLPKISLILQKMKIGQKSDIRPFCTKAFNYVILVNSDSVPTATFFHYSSVQINKSTTLLSCSLKVTFFSLPVVTYHRFVDFSSSRGASIDHTCLRLGFPCLTELFV